MTDNTIKPGTAADASAAPDNKAPPGFIPLLVALSGLGPMSMQAIMPQVSARASWASRAETAMVGLRASYRARPTDWLTLEGGLGIYMYAWNYGAGCGGGPGCNGHSDIWLISRVAAGVTYTAPFGLMVSLTPFGGGGVWGSGGSGYYDGSLLIGYRWQ